MPGLFRIRHSIIYDDHDVEMDNFQLSYQIDLPLRSLCQSFDLVLKMPSTINTENFLKAFN